MDMHPVDSKMLSHIGFDPVTRLLRVQFRNGGTYEYTDVPPEAHHALMKADSIGKHFFGEIRNKFKATKL